MNIKKLRQQILLWTSIFGSLVLFVWLMSFLGQISQGNRTIGTQKRFTARPGTERKKSIVITRKSKEEDSGGEHTRERKSDSNGESSEDTPEDPSDNRSGGRGKPVSPHMQAIEEALNSLKPESGIERLQQYLASLAEFEKVSEIYSAMGTLYLQTSPPDIKRYEEAFARAEHFAISSEEKFSVLFQHSKILIEEGKTKEVLKDIEKSFSEDDSITPSMLELSIIQAKLYEDYGKTNAAESIYKTVMDNALTFPANEKKVEDIYRIAGLRLSRLYNKLGEKILADAVVRKVKARFDQF